MKLTYLCALGLSLSFYSAYAQSETEREHGSHEHGASTLNLVLDGKKVFLEFSSPWANLSGFEHRPSNDEQQGVVETVLSDFASPQSLFVFDGGDCNLEHHDVESTMAMMDEEHEEHEEHESHSELSATYEYICEKPEALNSVNVKLFDHWPGIESITVQMAGSSGQSAETLSPTLTRLDVSGIR